MESASPPQPSKFPPPDDRKQGPREKQEKLEKSEPRDPEDPPPNDGLIEG